MLVHNKKQKVTNVGKDMEKIGIFVHCWWGECKNNIIAIENSMGSSS
jgi:hypothetical protein